MSQSTVLLSLPSSLLSHLTRFLTVADTFAHFSVGHPTLYQAVTTSNAIRAFFDERPVADTEAMQYPIRIRRCVRSLTFEGDTGPRGWLLGYVDAIPLAVDFPALHTLSLALVSPRSEEVFYKWVFFSGEGEQRTTWPLRSLRYSSDSFSNDGGWLTMMLPYWAPTLRSLTLEIAGSGNQHTAIEMSHRVYSIVQAKMHGLEVLRLEHADVGLSGIEDLQSNSDDGYFSYDSDDGELDDNTVEALDPLRYPPSAFTPARENIVRLDHHSTAAEEIMGQLFQQSPNLQSLYLAGFHPRNVFSNAAALARLQTLHWTGLLTFESLPHMAKLGNVENLTIDFYVDEKELKEEWMHGQWKFEVQEKVESIGDNAQAEYEMQDIDGAVDPSSSAPATLAPLLSIPWNGSEWLLQFQQASTTRHSGNLHKLRRDVYTCTCQAVRQGGYVLPDGREVRLNLKNEYEQARKGSVFYPKTEHLTVIPSLRSRFRTRVSVESGDILEVARSLQLRLGAQKPVCVLNMASRNNPGGGVRNGDGAQEENLFRRSNAQYALYQYVDSHAKEYSVPLHSGSERYPIERSSTQRSGGIFSPGVWVFRTAEMKGYEFLDQPFQVSVLTVPAISQPDKPSKLSELQREGMTRKIRTIFRIAAQHGQTNLVLSAFGCGAFGNPPSDIADIFHSVLFSEPEFQGVFEQVTFAIYEDHNSGKRHNPDGNLVPFQRVFEKKMEKEQEGNVAAMEIDSDTTRPCSLPKIGMSGDPNSIHTQVACVNKYLFQALSFLRSLRSLQLQSTNSDQNYCLVSWENFALLKELTHLTKMQFSSYFPSGDNCARPIDLSFELDRLCTLLPSLQDVILNIERDRVEDSDKLEDDGHDAKGQNMEGDSRSILSVSQFPPSSSHRPCPQSSIQPYIRPRATGAGVRRLKKIGIWDGSVEPMGKNASEAASQCILRSLRPFLVSYPQIHSLNLIYCQTGSFQALRHLSDSLVSLCLYKSRTPYASESRDDLTDSGANDPNITALGHLRNLGWLILNGSGDIDACFSHAQLVQLGRVIDARMPKLRNWRIEHQPAMTAKVWNAWTRPSNGSQARPIYLRALRSLSFKDCQRLSYKGHAAILNDVAHSFSESVDLPFLPNLLDLNLLGTYTPAEGRPENDVLVQEAYQRFGSAAQRTTRYVLVQSDVLRGSTHSASQHDSEAIVM